MPMMQQPRNIWEKLHLHTTCTCYKPINKLRNSNDWRLHDQTDSWPQIQEIPTRNYESSGGCTAYNGCMLSINSASNAMYVLILYTFVSYFIFMHIYIQVQQHQPKNRVFLLEFNMTDTNINLTAPRAHCIDMSENSPLHMEHTQLLN